MPYKILIVDDSKLARMAVIKTVQARYPDWTRVEAGSTDDALKAILQSPPDVVLLDFNMPGRNGFELLDELRRLNPRMPMAVISANHQQEVINRAEQAGARFLHKPITEQALGDFLDAAARELNSGAS
jgi:DNA-binding NarL/FixJ family response regulator